MEDDRDGLEAAPSVRARKQGTGVLNVQRTATGMPMVKGNWTADEDDLLAQLVEEYGQGRLTEASQRSACVTRWSSIAKHLPGRVGKQCRERWHNNLRPDLKKGEWTFAEEIIIFGCWLEWGPQWAKISRVLEGRSDNRVKNHWNCHMKRRIDRDAETGPYVQFLQTAVKDLSLAKAIQDIMHLDDCERVFKERICPQIADYVRAKPIDLSPTFPPRLMTTPRKSASSKAERSPKKQSKPVRNGPGIGSIAAALLKKPNLKLALREITTEDDAEGDAELQHITDISQFPAALAVSDDELDGMADDGASWDEDFELEKVIPKPIRSSPKKARHTKEMRITKPATPKKIKPERSPSYIKSPKRIGRPPKGHSKPKKARQEDLNAYAAVSQAPPVLQLPSVNLLEQMQSSTLSAVEALIALSALTAPTTCSPSKYARQAPTPVAFTVAHDHKRQSEEAMREPSGTREKESDGVLRRNVEEVKRGRRKRMPTESVVKVEVEEEKVEMPQLSSSGRPMRTRKRGKISDLLRNFDRDIQEGIS